MPKQNYKVMQSYVVGSTAKPFEPLMEELEQYLQRRLEVTESFVMDSELDVYVDSEPTRVRVNVEKENGTQNEGFLISATVEQPDNEDTQPVTDAFNELDSGMENVFDITEKRYE